MFEAFIVALINEVVTLVYLLCAYSVKYCEILWTRFEKYDFLHKLMFTIALFWYIYIYIYIYMLKNY